MAPKTVTFHSKHPNLCLTRLPRIEVTSASTGVKHVTQPGVRYQFGPAADGKGGLIGTLDVRPTRDKLVDGDGWLARGESDDIERDAVEALKAHAWFGRPGEHGKRFWLAGWGPETLEPRPEDYRRDLMIAVAGLDEDTIVTMLAAEKKGHARGELVRDADVALESVRAALAAAVVDDAEKAEKK